MSDYLDPILLTKWLTGQLDPDERQALERWLTADPAYRESVTSLGFGHGKRTV